MKIYPAILLLLLASCTSGPPLQDYTLPAASVELVATPFFPQQRYQCGPAALATVLAAGGVVVTPEQLTPYVYLPGRRGSLQAEMVAATRRHKRIPYILRPSLDDLLKEVSTGTPVLVMLNLGVKLLPRWHYAVVIGYHVPSDSLLLRSAARERRRMSRARFQGAWLRADNWAMVAVKPDKLPATAQTAEWLRTASALEELGQLVPAVQAYEAATRRWPWQPLAWLALANGRYAMRDLPSAEHALRRALKLAPSATVHNNLAHVLYERGCQAEAAAQIRLAVATPDAADIATVLEKTRLMVNAGANLPSVRCVPMEDYVGRDIAEDK